MKPEIILISIGLLLNFVSAKNLPIGEISEDGNLRLLILKDNDNTIHFLNEPPPIISRAEVSEEEVTYYYKSRATESTPLFAFTAEEILKTDFNPNRSTMFIIHGWNNNADSQINSKISDALLSQEDWNIFIVDWREKANTVYSVALGAVPGVADITAKFIGLLMELTNIKLEKINLSGHSLGAHICGRVGHFFDGKVETIVGMDAALPFVDQNDPDKHLDPTDAKYVQVIHTNAGLLGFAKAIGHADFYPNGGMNQKGCGLDILGKCAHSRSFLYFAESITNDNFKARVCDSMNDWKNGICADNEIAYMGGNVLKKAYGTFYLDTEGKEPFALG